MLIPATVQASSIEITINSISSEGVGDSRDSISAGDTNQGLVIIPSLCGLNEREHRSQLHEGKHCDPQTNAEGMSIAELTALGDWDPDGINTLHGPFANDHRGDLSRWVVDSDGNTTTTWW